MTALRTPRSRRADGGLPARRAVVRWSWRLLRRDWRSQILVTMLLTTAVTLAVCGGTALYNAPPPGSAHLGTAEHRVKFTVPDAATATAAVTALHSGMKTADVIEQAFASAPGYATPIEYRAQNLRGFHTGPILSIHRGRAPSGPSEAAVTDGTAELLGLRLGGTIGLDGTSRTIIGIAENPADLGDEFVLVPPGTITPQAVSVLYSGDDEIRRLIPAGISLDREDLPTGPSEKAVVTTLVLGAATILLLLVSFVAAAGFAVLAQRRLVQLGMFGAIGGTSRQIRLVVSANGLLVGGLAALLGTVAGVALWLPLAPVMEPRVHHRIDPLALPWPLIAMLAALTVFMAAVAAWWPARAVSRLPVATALSGRPPAPRPAHRPALLSAGLLTAGIGCLALGQKTDPTLVITGTVATALAIMFAAPLAVSALAAAGRSTPIGMRLALRDLSRHRARSAAAVAAISLALGIPVATVIIATGAQTTPATGNLDARQLLVRFTEPDGPHPQDIPRHTSQELTALTDRVNLMAGDLPEATLIPLTMAYDPAAERLGREAPAAGTQRAITLGVPQGSDQTRDVPTYVVSPGLLAALGVRTVVPPTADVITGGHGKLVLPPYSRGKDFEEVATARVPMPAYTSLPTTLLTANTLERRRWRTLPAGWLISAKKPLTGPQIAEARKIAADTGLNIEVRDSQQSLGSVRAGATAIGCLLALGILAMTVGLIRSEAEADLSTLAATGANSRIRRTLTATTAAALALLGATLGTLGATLALGAVYRQDLGVFTRISPAYPMTLLTLPLLAYTTAWLLAGREPPTLTRRLSD
ncbi:FtsX-like permease family protein [Actinocorallia longicatena]|uniref:ABC3 transporter permease C-terminal domain-containing protein n=1 Tax=Actinocorallia longicatena TaxID=111803 RepID=A0ABP6QDQ8_9ACTN